MLDQEFVTEKQHASALSIEPELLRPERQHQVRLHLSADDGTSIDLPDELVGVVLSALRVVRDGGGFSIASMPEELTTSAAAHVLGISRPTLMKRVREGAIASHKVGTHTRFKASDILELRARQRAAQRRAVLEMMELETDIEDFS
ncbi:helix-turn-helix domain-containing protein [Schaalia sp. 19OD2882]|uniref:helix-turn-helix domain-containing protein n=1 Tax=Schaalia sp. 19OD2882 TaxID=2794089 RepID=UPI001C1E9B6F|nr:helix-turn-helix domain-containing protein [Schaalia sp. 19OD2882]QWW19511.1 helix-turn-helix domain-containing protein [Schaalia sp. 19OD2882]